MKKLLIALLISLFSLSLYAQPKITFKGEPKVGVARMGIQIEYEIDLPPEIKWCEIAVFLSTDGGKTFNNEPLSAIYPTRYSHLESSGKQIVLWVPRQEKHLLEGKGTDLAFEIRVVRSAKPKKVKDAASAAMSKKRGGFLLAANIGVYPELSYGGMIGWAGRFGFYAKFRSNFVSVLPAYECLSDGTTSNGYMWTTGNEVRQRMVVTGGALFGAARWLYFYVGGGYGKYLVAWEDNIGDYAKVTDLSFSGFSLDAGILLKMGAFTITLGANSTSFKHTDFEAGLGFMF